MKRIRQRLAAEVRALRGANAEAVIRRLNPIIRGLNAFLATASTPSSAPVIVATRLRKGSANSARARPGWSPTPWSPPGRAGSTGTVVLRADSAFYGRDVIAAARRGRRPVLHHRPQGPGRHRGDRLDPRRRVDHDPLPESGVRRSNSASGCPTPRSPRSRFTAFASRRKADQVTARLIVRRVRDANPDHVDRRTRRASCSRSGGTTPCSPTHPCRC